MNIEDAFFIICNLCGYNISFHNKDLMTTICTVIEDMKSINPTDYILVGSDFNMTPDDWKDRYLSRFDTHHFNNTVMDFCNTLMLEDVWRVKNPEVLQYSWFNPDQTCKSRIDYWLLTYGLSQHVSDISMDIAPLTDHSLIHLELKPNINSKRNRGFWKFNSNLLKDEEYCRNIRAMVDESINDPEIQSYANKWEF